MSKHKAPGERPLDDAELDELDHLLTEALGLPTAMNLPMLDGFFAALLCGPRTVLPSEWLSIVCDPDEGEDLPVFPDKARMERFFDLVFRHMNSRATLLQESPEDYSAILYAVAAAEIPEILSMEIGDAAPAATGATGAAEGPAGRTATAAGPGDAADEDEDAVPVPIDWCEGFLRGVRTDIEGWTPYIESDSQLFPVAVGFGSDEGLAELAARKETLTAEDFEAVSLILLPELVREAHAFFLEQRRADPRIKGP
jgi:uncharacterized protein YecA (UPF0149 family)